MTPLLAQISGPLGSVIADGAYDGEPVYRAVAERQSDPPVAVLILPRSTAAWSRSGVAGMGRGDVGAQFRLLTRAGSRGRSQATRWDTGIPSLVIRFSTAQPVRASVF